MLNLPEPYQQILRQLLTQYAPEYEVLAFGSRVNGQAHEGSDLDLALRHPTHPLQECPTLPALRTAVSESSLPMLIEVHDWARLPESFRAEIIRQYVLI